MDAVPSFGAELRRLRTERGTSLAGLSERTHYSKGYLSKLETGAKRASVELAARLDDALETGGRLVELVAAEQRPVCPYRGLEPYGAADAKWFFGREETTADLLDVALAALADRRPVVVVGPSGVGKSSLVRAGLQPALATGGLPGTAGWPVRTITPTADPMAEWRRSAPDGGPRVLIVDQFEELFTLCEDEPGRRRFVEALAGLAASGEGLVVLSLRADFYDRCLAYPELVAALRHHQVTVGPMTQAQLAAAIAGPADAAGLDLEPGLVEVLLADIGDSAAGALPLLSHALLATWQERDGSTLTVAGYRRAGGIAGAVASTAEEAFGSLDPAEQDAARRLLLRLVRVGVHEQDTRRPVRREQLLRQLPGQARMALQELTAARLLTVDADVVRITHEALLHAWPRLREWIAADREGLRVHHRLSEATETWEAEQQHPSLLYRGPRLALAGYWAADHDDRLSPAERAFLTASREAADGEARRERRQTRRLRSLVTGLAVLSVLVAVAATVAVSQSRAADTQRDIAVSRELASEANQLRQTDPELATQLSLAAYRVADTPQARGSLLGASGSTPVTRFKPHPGSITGIAFTGGSGFVTTGLDGTTRFFALSGPGAPVPHAVLRGGAESVTALAVAPGRSLLATADEADATRLWSTADADRPALLGSVPSREQPLTLALNGAGTLLAAGREDGGVDVWDIRDPARPVPAGTLPPTGKAVRALAFSPVSAELLIGGDDFTARLWDVAGAPGPAFDTHTATIRSVAFSPDGSTAAVGSDDRTVDLFAVTDPHHPALLRQLTGHTNAVQGLAFSPDGQTVATTSDDQTVRLWNTADASTLTSLSEPAPARLAAFAPDGATLVTGDDLGGLWLWHLPPPTLANRGGTAMAVFDPHRPQLAFGADDGVVHLRALADHREVGTIADGPGKVWALAYAPKAPLLVVAGADRVARLWDVSDPARPRAVASLGEAATVYTARFRPDGKLLALSGTAHDVVLWDVADPAHPVRLPDLTGHTNAVDGLAFSPDGRLLATGSDDYSSRIWDVSDPRSPRFLDRLTDHSNAVASVDFSPDGTTLATASEDHTVHLLDVRDPGHPVQVAELTGPADAISQTAFSPDGHLLATVGFDATARVWDVSDRTRPQALAVLTGHTGLVISVAFSPDSRQLVTAGEDHTVRLWTTGPDDVAARICALSGPPLTAEQWSYYVPDLPFRPLC
ncbi:helix-turn-helix domain-containing protein [Streptomyces sp. MN03-5084-2B]|nr:helix-turn-helix domain-containing protein [Streptomyces sp. MN03-5084-2B]